MVLLTCSVLLFVHPIGAKLFYPGADGQIMELFAPQLWYNGYWKNPGWLNMSIVTSKSNDVRGKLVLLNEIVAPYEHDLRTHSARGVAGIVVLRDRTGEPGQNMYLLDLSDQNSITVPVVEVFQSKKSKNALVGLQDNTELIVELLPDPNPWKKVNENRFQMGANIFLSLFELAIISIALFRLYQFWSYEGIRPSIAQICLSLELTATLLRLGYTFVDPFWTYRMMHNTASSFLVTIHIPFSLSSAILLSFFWAESLTKTSVKATPFISQYKRTAIIVCAALFVGEIACYILRILVASSKMAISPNTVAAIFYLVVSLIVTGCYIACAISILRRIGRASAKHNVIRRMTVRFVASTTGYIILLFVDFYSIFRLNWAWSFKIVFNMVFLCFNIAALLQVMGFKPIESSRSRSRSFSAKNPKSNSAF